MKTFNGFGMRSAPGSGSSTGIWKKKTNICVRGLFVVLTLLFVSGALFAVNKKKPLETNVKEGVYIQTDRVTVRKMRDLPIPSSSEDYAFLQSIDNVTNIVLGSFSNSENKITLISDENADEVVDYIIHYYTDTKKFTKEPNPSSVYGKEAFIQMKKDIINGTRRGPIVPNNEGLIFLKRLINGKNEAIAVLKTKQGYTVKITDADEKSMTRTRYMYSNNGSRGVDLVFFIAYTNVYETRVQPVIQYSVYCNNSFDPTVKAVVDDLLKITAESNLSR